MSSTQRRGKKEQKNQDKQNLQQKSSGRVRHRRHSQKDTSWLVKTSRYEFEKLDLDPQIKSKTQPSKTEFEKYYQKNTKHYYQEKEEQGRKKRSKEGSRSSRAHRG